MLLYIKLLVFYNSTILLSVWFGVLYVIQFYFKVLNLTAFQESRFLFRPCILWSNTTVACPPPTPYLPSSCAALLCGDIQTDAVLYPLSPLPTLNPLSPCGEQGCQIHSRVFRYFGGEIPLSLAKVPPFGQKIPLLFFWYNMPYTAQHAILVCNMQWTIQIMHHTWIIFHNVLLIYINMKTFS